MTSSADVMINEDIYKMAEYHSSGINSDEIDEILKKTGFSQVHINYHWYGLNKITDNMFGKKKYKKGFAPLLQVIVVK